VQQKHVINARKGENMPHSQWEAIISGSYREVRGAASSKTKECTKRYVGLNSKIRQDFRLFIILKQELPL
jgi:hypothetical protein